MQLDFWNNPLVVTAMRLKFRRGSPGIWAVMWVLALLGVGALLHHLSQTEGFRFPTAYLIVIISVQCVVSAMIAVITTSSSMNAEVVNRTLDFQRIVTLSPRAILIGKMMGEPALSYFLMIGSIPLAAICWGLGAASGAVVFWLYVNVATFALMAASLGLINSLTPPAQSAGRQKSAGGGSAGFVILFAVVPQLLIHGRNALDTPGVGDVVQMLTPLGSLIRLWEDNAWNAQIGFWGVSFPSLLVAPVVQLAIAAWIVSAMSRRLKNSLNPLASKPRSYATLAVVDLIIAAICYSQWLSGVDATKLAYGYGLAHMIACILLMFATVPRRAAVISWIWRREPGRSRLAELMTADRSPMTAAAFMYSLIGLAVFAIALVGPIYLTADAGRQPVPLEDLGQVCLLTATLVVSMALLHQLLSATTSRGGHMLFVLFVILANLLPPVIAATLRAVEQQPSEEFLQMLGSLSPVALLTYNMSRVGGPPGGGAPLIVLYAAIGVLSYWWLRRALRREAGVVRTKLQNMGLSPAAA
jgi:hypothetical protein